jgi:hypothetical protein
VTMEEFPSTIREINRLSDAEKTTIYHTLLPEWVSTCSGAVYFRFPSGSRALEITVKRDAGDRDPLMYLNMVDTFNNQILILLLVVNDLDGPRFNIDIDQDGNKTHLGTASRNIPAEVAALQAGLAPGQVRRGLRVFKTLVPIMEQFVQRMGHDIFLIEPLAYHNAIVFERYGFNYVRGLAEMKRIHDSFQLGGVYRNRLNSDSPFRQVDAWQSVRGRSWAIHDGILGHPFTGFQMYKRVGHDASICTSPHTTW